MLLDQSKKRLADLRSEEKKTQNSSDFSKNEKANPAS